MQGPFQGRLIACTAPKRPARPGVEGGAFGMVGIRETKRCAGGEDFEEAVLKSLAVPHRILLLCDAGKFVHAGGR